MAVVERGSRGAEEQGSFLEELARVCVEDMGISVRGPEHPRVALTILQRAISIHALERTADGLPQLTLPRGGSSAM